MPFDLALLRRRRAVGSFPTASFNFLSGILDSRITFSRGTNATLIDSTGRLTYAPANLMTFSQDFSNAVWSPTGSTIIGGQADSQGGLTAGRITATAGNARHGTISGSGIASRNIYSMEFKQGTHRYAQIAGSSGGFSANFDLQTGLVGSAGGAKYLSHGMTSLGNGWYRCWVYTDNTSGTDGGWWLMVTSASSPNLESWTATGTESIFVGRAQLEPVTYQTTPSTYVATTASAYYGPRFDYDPVTLAPRGLLIEEARTNLLTYSEQFNDATWSKSTCTITANSTAAPTGTAVADTMVSQALTAFTFCLQAVTFASATYTASVFVKAAGAGFVQLLWTGAASADYVNVNVATGAITAGTYAGASVTPFGNGWYRITLTSAIAAGAWGFYIALVDSGSAARAASFTGDGVKGAYLFGAQTELGSFATSYIPTVASTVTRNADVATMTGTNFSSWYNQSEGTFVADAVPAADLNNSYAVAASDGATNEFIGARYANPTSAGAYVIDGGAIQFAPAGFSAAPTISHRWGLGYKVNDFALSVDGATPQTDALGTLPTVDRLTLGGPTSATVGAWRIRTIAYFNTRLPNAQLQTLTAPSLATTLSLDFTSGSYNVGF